MSAVGTRPSPVLLTALGVLLVTGLYVGIRSKSAASLVLSSSSHDVSEARIAEPVEVKRAREKDALLTAVQGSDRDPLAPVPRRNRPARRSEPAAPAEVVPPELRMFLYDQVNPLVQISVEGALSGKLSTGHSFAGWRVDAITSDSAVVSKDGKQFSLSLRRSQ